MGHFTSLNRKNAEKLVKAVTSDDNEPTWQDRLKNNMGYSAAARCAEQIHGAGKGRGHLDAKQLLDDLGVKPYTENDQAEVVQNRLEPEKNEPKGS